MSTFDYPDPGTDDTYCNGLSEPPDGPQCRYCGDPMPLAYAHEAYCSSLCASYAEHDECEDRL